MAQTLEEAWPLVVRHFEDVVRVLDTRPTALRRKVSRGDLLRDCRHTRDIHILAAKHEVSPSVISGILARAVKVARACERGRPPSPPRPRKTVTVSVPAVPMTLVREIDAWAASRGQFRREAAIELWKAALDVLSLRAERQTDAQFREKRPRATNTGRRG